MDSKRKKTTIISLVIAFIMIFSAVYYYFPNLPDNGNGDYVFGKTTFFALKQDSSIGATEENYLTVWQREWGTPTPGSSILSCGQWCLEYDPDEPLVYDIYRALVFFDSSSLPDDAIITECIISLNAYYMPTLNVPEFSVIVQDGKLAHTPPLDVDYNKELYGTDVGGHRSVIGTVVEGTYWNITLNEKGCTWITVTGITKLCIRTNRENAGDIPTLGAPEFLEFCSANYGQELGEGDPVPPILYITYKVKV